MVTDTRAKNTGIKDTQANNKVLDKGGAVREGEELDAKAVSEWLRNQNVEVIGEPTVTQFSGGASNWTYRLQYEGDNKNQDLILRRPPKGTKAKSAHDMVREYTVQHALKDAYPYVPKMVALCTDEDVIGADFYVMERMEGIIPRANLPKGIDLDPEQTRVLCTNVIDALVELHQVDYKAHPDLVNLGRYVFTKCLNNSCVCSSSSWYLARSSASFSPNTVTVRL